MVTIEKGRPVHKRSDRIYYFVLGVLIILLILLALSFSSNNALRHVTQMVDTSGRISGAIQRTFITEHLSQDTENHISYVNSLFDDLIREAEKHPYFFSDEDVRAIKTLKSQWEGLASMIQNDTFTEIGHQLIENRLWQQSESLSQLITAKATSFRVFQTRIVAALLIALLTAIVLMVFMKRVFITGLINSTLTDQLTGLYNRTYMRDYIDHFCSHSHATFRNTRAFILADIDHFKKINDTYGHQKGDEVLASIAAILKAYTDSSSLLFRYGGEEFLILRSFDSEEQAVTFAETIRIGIQNTLHADLSLSMSFGIGLCSGAPDFHRVIGYADTALYAAKDAGRNCIWVQKDESGAFAASTLNI